MTDSSLFSPKDLIDAEREALEQAIRFATLPLIAERDSANNQKEIYPLGTGLLFDAEGRLFLVTAKHVLDEVGLDGLFFSPAPTTAEKVESFGSGIIFRHDYDVDVVVIELTEVTVIDTLSVRSETS